MTVRAKFRVTSISRIEHSLWDAETKTSTPAELQSIKLAPVYGNNDPEHENSKFWKASPQGEITLGTINKAAGDAFELGAEYYVDFTKAPV